MLSHFETSLQFYYMASVADDRFTSVPGITLVPIRQEDMEFLYRVYASTRIEEMRLVTDWTEDEKNAFLCWQFQMQHQHYQTYYPQANYNVIVKDETPIGRLYVAAGSQEIRVMDIALLPPYRNKGIGTSLVREILAEAEENGQIVSLHVEAENPAKHLYERLGFVVVGEAGIYQLLHWVPGKRNFAGNDGLK